MPSTINTTSFSAALRSRAIDIEHERLLITTFLGSEQEKDLTEPPNCRGIGRIRHFRRHTSQGWPENPLPIDPACRALSLSRETLIRAQVFQNAACNWRCWYCFVDFPLLSADSRKARWISAAELIDLYLDEPNRPSVIDLTGGQPDLTPEWVPWMIRELNARGLDRSIYLWSDDNLSNDYLWRFLDRSDIDLLRNYQMYGKVGCFKGFNSESFSFNTGAHPSLFDQQFDLLGRLLELGLDQYAYVTFTTPTDQGILPEMKQFVDRLQRLDENLPLRTIPLEISVFAPVVLRKQPKMEEALGNQHRAVEAWQEELDRRFTSTERAANIVDVPLRRRSG